MKTVEKDVFKIHRNCKNDEGLNKRNLKYEEKKNDALSGISTKGVEKYMKTGSFYAICEKIVKTLFSRCDSLTKVFS